MNILVVCETIKPIKLYEVNMVKCILGETVYKNRKSSPNNVQS
jgi:hypothetical protein